MGVEGGRTGLPSVTTCGMPKEDKADSGLGPQNAESSAAGRCYRLLELRSNQEAHSQVSSLTGEVCKQKLHLYAAGAGRMCTWNEVLRQP